MWGNAGCFPRPVQPLLFISYTGSAPIWTNYARRLTQPIAGRTIFLTTLAVEKKNVEHVVDNGEWRTGTRNVMYVYEENSATAEMQTGMRRKPIVPLIGPGAGVWQDAFLCRTAPNLSSGYSGELVRRGFSFADSRLHWIIDERLTREEPRCTAVAVRGRASFLPNLGRLGRIEQ